MKPKKVEMAFTGADMTPMIDIVFQLLTFFMIAVNFENAKADERVKLPIDALAKPPESKLDNELILNVGFKRRPDGTHDGQPYIFYNGADVPLERIAPSLEQEAKFFKAKSQESATALEDVAVIIRADSEVPTGVVQELIGKCQEAGFTRFSLKATQKQD